MYNLCISSAVTIIVLVFNSVHLVIIIIMLPVCHA